MIIGKKVKIEDIMKDDVFDARIYVSAGYLIIGRPLAGNSTFVLNLLENADRLLSHHFHYVIWFYGTPNKTAEYSGFRLIEPRLIEPIAF